MTVATRRPERTCIGCRTKRPQALMVRVAAAGDGQLRASRTAPGRGAWLCDPPGRCLQMARRRRGFERALRQPVDAAAIDELEQALVPREEE